MTNEKRCQTCGTLRHHYRCPQCRRRRAREIYRAQHPAPILSTTRNAANVRRQVIKLAGWYVRMLLSENTRVPPNAWPQQLVQLKRVTLHTKRSWKLQN